MIQRAYRSVPPSAGAGERPVAGILNWTILRSVVKMADIPDSPTHGE